MAFCVLPSVNVAVSIGACRDCFISRGSVTPSPWFFSTSKHHSSLSYSRTQTASVGRRELVQSTLASLLLMAASSARGIENLYEDWYRYQGSGFALSVPPDFEDIREPEEYVGGPLYGNKAKPKTFEARFASADRSEVLSVVVRPSSQLKLSFLAAKDVTDLGSLKESAKIFVPAGAKLYAARVINPTEENSKRTYYYYEFTKGDNYIALEAGASSGQVYVLGVTAPKEKWKDDYKKLRLAASSFCVL